MRTKSVILVTIALVITLILGVFAVSQLEKYQENKKYEISYSPDEYSSGTAHYQKAPIFEPPTVVNSYRSCGCKK